MNSIPIFYLPLAMCVIREMQNQSLMHVNDNDFEREVLKSDVLVIADFYADWCGPCRIVGPTIDALSREYDGKVKFVKVNVDDNQGLAIKYDVRSIPTVMIFKNAEVVDRMVGVQTAYFYRQRINTLLGSRQG